MVDFCEKKNQKLDYFDFEHPTDIDCRVVGFERHSGAFEKEPQYISNTLFEYLLQEVFRENAIEKLNKNYVHRTYKKEGTQKLIESDTQIQYCQENS